MLSICRSTTNVVLSLVRKKLASLEPWVVKEQPEEQTPSDKGLASLALFSLTYVTRDTLADEAAATEFYRGWIDNNKLQLDVELKDIPELIDLAKRGESWLENYLKA